MQLEIKRSDLSRLLSAVGRVVQPRATVPILSNLVLTAEDGRLTARGTDLDVEITASEAAAVSAPGTACVSSKNIADIVKRMIGDTVSLEMESGSPGVGVLHIKSGRSRFKLPSISSTAMPTLAGATFTHSFEADIGALCAPVVHAVGSDQTRHYLTGVYLHEDDGNLRAVGADGARMAIYDAPLPDGAAGMPAVIVPTRVVDLAGRGVVSLRLCAERIEISSGSTVISAKLIEGNYVDYKRAIPNGDKTAVLSKAEFAGAVGRVGIVANETAGRPVKLSWSAGAVALSAADSTGGQANDEVAADYAGPDTEVAFNASFLDAILAAVPGDEVALCISGPTGLALFKSTSDAAFTGVVGPYRA